MTGTHKAKNAKGNWALMYMENSDVTCSANIRFFRHRKNAHAAMENDFKKQDAILNFPTNEDTSAENYRSVTYESIYVQMGIDTFHWEIVKILPEDI